MFYLYKETDKLIKQDDIWSEKGDKWRKHMCEEGSTSQGNKTYMHIIQHDVFKEHSWGQDCLDENLNKGWETMSQKNSEKSWRNGG